jgi:hypothetical protein
VVHDEGPGDAFLCKIQVAADYGRNYGAASLQLKDRESHLQCEQLMTRAQDLVAKCTVQFVVSVQSRGELLSEALSLLPTRA